MAAKKIDAKLRGAALVERAIAVLPIRAPKPVPPKVLAKLTLGDKPLPPSLRRWLAHHHALPRPYGTKLLEGEGLTPTSWAKIADRAVGRDSGLGGLAKHVPGNLLPLDVGDEQFRALFVGTPDAAGEYAVLDVDIGYGPTVTLALPGFDVWLAVVAGLLDARKARTMHAAAIAAHARRDFGGAEAWEKRAQWTAQKKATWEPPPFPKPRHGKPLDDETELVWAIREGELEMVRELLDEGIAPSSYSKSRSEWSLHAAANCAHPAILALLLDRGAPVDHWDTGSKRNTLQVIAQVDWWWYAKTSPELCDRWLACAHLLLERGTDVNACDGAKRTPLHLAAGRRSLALVSLFVEHGADVNAKTKGGGNALHDMLTVPLGKKTQPAQDVVACLELLLARGIDKTLRDRTGSTPLSLAKSDPEIPKRVLALLGAE